MVGETHRLHDHCLSYRCTRKLGKIGQLYGYCTRHRTPVEDYRRFGRIGRPVPLFKYQTKEDQVGEPHLGIELETEPKYEAVHRIATHIVELFPAKHIWCKPDGSLRDGGCEIVTHPMTLSYIKKMPFEKMLKYLDDQGVTSEDNGHCGMHIHVGMEFFQDTRRAHLQVASMRNLLLWISRRRETSWCHFNAGSTGKGAACSLRDHTVEYRFPRGTLNYTTFMAMVECVYTLAWFSNVCKETSNIEEEYIRFVKECPGVEVLWDWLVNRSTRKVHYKCPVTVAKEVSNATNNTVAQA